jgi:Fe2+ transport system protein FeoA
MGIALQNEIHSDLPHAPWAPALVVTLDKIAPGQTVRVKSLSSVNPELFRKLHAMGVVAGGKITVVGRAPFGDPISIQTLGYTLSLRNSEASHIEVVSEI